MSAPTLKERTWKSMTEEEFYKLLGRYQLGKCSSKEKKLVEDFFEQNEQKPGILSSWKAADKSALSARLKHNVLKAIDKPKSKSKRTFINRWAGIAASVVLGLFIISSLLNKGVNVPGAEIKYITKNTEKGQKLTTKLSDGTTVQLNAGSSITFPEHFSSKDRQVTMSGEAFFNVSEDHARPFIISTGDLTTQVLGTSFNIEAYPEDTDIRVTVESGKVLVTKNNDENISSVLTSGQQAHYDMIRHKLEWRQVRMDAFINWKNGVLQFNDISMVEAIKKMERWYGVEFEYDNSKMLNNCFISSTYTEESLEHVLQSMKFITGLSYKFLSKEKIKITGTQCTK